MSKSSPGKRGTFVVFADDWGRHPSSCQHLFKHLLDDYEVVWVNTIGMRRPSWDGVTLRRGLEKLSQWLGGKWRSAGPGNLAGKGPRVLNPWMWPWYDSAWQRRLNRLLLDAQVNKVVRHCISPRVAVTTIPIVADLIGRLAVDRWIYYCVDDFRNWPEMNRAIEVMEKLLVERADRIVAAGKMLKKHIEELGRQAWVLPHGIDLELWTKGAEGGDVRMEIPALSSCEKPWIVFWGSINWQIDTRVLEAIGQRLTRGSLIMCGPVTDCDSAIHSVRRLVLPGVIPYEKLPLVAAEADVLIMPYRTGPGVDESEPLKLREYLASGKPAVVCDIPATQAWQDALDIAKSPEEFADLVLQRLVTGIPPEQLAARKPLREDSWSVKAERFAVWATEGLRAGERVSSGTGHMVEEPIN